MFPLLPLNLYTARPEELLKARQKQKTYYVYLLPPGFQLQKNGFCP
jgi:hypothetical protein